MQHFRGVGLVLSGLLVGHLSLAQIDSTVIDAVREKSFRMTKATVEFLASDTKTYGGKHKRKCDECVSYDNLKQFIRDEKLTKADALVNDAQKQVDALIGQNKPAEAVLADLQKYLISRVTDGPDRQHRTKLDTYPAFQRELSSISGDQTPEDPSGEVAMAANPNVAEDSTETATAPESTATTADNGWLSKSGLALVLSILNLGLLAYFISRQGKAKGTATIDITDPAYKELRQQVFDLKTTTNELRSELAGLRKERSQGGTGSSYASTLGQSASATQRPAASPTNSPAPKLTPAPNTSDQTSISPTVEPVTKPSTEQTSQPQRPVTAESSAPTNRLKTTPVVGPPSTNTTEPAPATAPQPAPAKPVSQPMAPAPLPVLFARTADLGDGFSADSLTETPNRPMIFEIRVQDKGEATYQIVDNPESQKLALSDPYSYLNDACDYITQPTPNSRIFTDQPGRLTLQGGKWKITEKARISFG